MDLNGNIKLIMFDHDECLLTYTRSISVHLYDLLLSKKCIIDTLQGFQRD